MEAVLEGVVVVDAVIDGLTDGVLVFEAVFVSE